MKILHLDANHPLLIQQLANTGFDNVEDYSSSKSEVEKIISNYEGIVIRSRFKIDKTFIDAASNIKFIARVGAGLESIDIPYAQSKGIVLISAPEGNRNAVGEHTLGMLLSLFNKLNKADKEVRSGLWLREENRGLELDGKTVGLRPVKNTQIGIHINLARVETLSRVNFANNVGRTRCTFGRIHSDAVTVWRYSLIHSPICEHII